MNGEYVYRGEKVNNYLKYSGKIWRIIKMTEDGYLKLVSTEASEDYFEWDDRYNIKTDSYVGLNNYEKSRMREYLNILYDDNKVIDDNFKDKIVMKPMCIGERSITDFSFTTTSECSKTIDGERIHLLSVVDPYIASIDENCKELEDESCTNYNYFEYFFDGSWTTIPVKDTTSKVYYLTLRYLDDRYANTEKSVNFVIYINADELIIEGDGTEESPYIIR